MDYYWSKACTKVCVVSRSECQETFVLFQSDHKAFPGVELHETVTLLRGKEILPINSNARLVILSLSNLNHENLFFMNNSEL